MGLVEVDDETVSDSETTVIGSTQVDADKDKNFEVTNKGANPVVFRAYGSADGSEWDLKDTKEVDRGNGTSLMVERNAMVYVKLTGQTKTTGQTSTVDAKLEW